MKLEQEIIDKFWTLPEWAQRELFYCDMGWEYTGNDIMGWDYVHRVGAESMQDGLYLKISIDGAINNSSWKPDGDTFDFDMKDSFRIPSSVKFYGRRLHSLFHNFDNDLEIDAELNGSNIEFSAFVNLNDNIEVITGIGKDSLTSSFDLFVKAVNFYEENYIPSLSNFEGVEDTFEDRNGDCAIDFKDIASISMIYNEYKRFCTNIKRLESGFMYGYGNTPDPVEKEHFTIKTVEGIAKVYSNYGKSTAMTIAQAGQGQMSLFGPPIGTAITGGYTSSAIIGGSNSFIGGGNSSTISGGYAIAAGPLTIGTSHYKKGKLKWKKPKKV